MTQAVDPVTLEIIRGSLASTIRDMELLMERCAMSPFIKEKKDYFVGVFDTRGRIVACHISGSGPGMLAPILRTYPLETMRPGDVYWFNDPYLSDGAVQHHQDMVFVVPVFHESAVIAFTVTFGPVKALDTGQSALAFSTCLRKAASSRPGTTAFVLNSIRLIVGPSPRCTVAVV